MASKTANSSCVADLPVALIEGIGNHLCLRDKVALTSCSAVVWNCKEVRYSSTLWGNLVIRTSFNSQLSLERWLQRRCAALGSLRLISKLHPDCLAFVLGCDYFKELSITAKQQALVKLNSPGGAPVPLQQRLTSLTLNNCKLRSTGGISRHLMLHLARFGSLQQLSLLGCNLNDSGFPCPDRPLVVLSNLTRLDLSDSKFRHTFPTQLSLLQHLASLELKCSTINLNEEHRGYTAALWRCTGLTYLGLRDCGLEQLPWRVSKLTNLVRLDLSNNLMELYEDGHQLEPLLFLTTIKFLDLHMAFEWDVSAAQVALLRQQGMQVVLHHSDSDDDSSMRTSVDVCSSGSGDSELEGYSSDSASEGSSEELSDGSDMSEGSSDTNSADEDSSDASASP